MRLLRYASLTAAICLVALAVGCAAHNRAVNELDTANVAALSSPGETAVAPSPAPTSDPAFVTFESPVVEAETRRLLGKPTAPVTADDLLTITEFGVVVRRGEAGQHVEYFLGDVGTLVDFSRFTDLTALYLRGCGVTSLEGIEGLESLETLDVSNNSVADISTLNDLTYLTTLNISGNPISDLSPVGGLDNLVDLNAADCQISDITPLSGKNLRRLNLWGNGIGDISPIMSLTDLEYVNLQGNPIPIAELAGFYAQQTGGAFIETLHARIHADVPALTLDLVGYCGGSNYWPYSVEEIVVSNAETGALIQTLNVKELAMFGRTYIDDPENAIDLFDYNFDGYIDFRLFDTTNGNYLLEHIYFLWTPEDGRFGYDQDLSDLPLAVFNAENRLIYGMARGSAVNHAYYTYKYIDGKLTQTRRYYEDILHTPYPYGTAELVGLLESAGATVDVNGWGDDALCFRETVYDLDEATGEWTVTRDEFVCYADGVDLARFDADSDIGRNLAATRP